MKLLKFLLLSFIFTTIIQAEGTPFILTGIKKVYPVVELHSDYVPKKYKDVIMEKIKNKLASLSISTEGFSNRSFAMIVADAAVGENPVIKIMFLIGEDVKRTDDNEEIFAITYMNNDIFDLEDVNETLPESVDFLLEQFAEQYQEDNQ